VFVLAVVPALSVGVHKFGLFLTELSSKTQAAAAEASSIAEVYLCNKSLLFSLMKYRKIMLLIKSLNQ